MRQLRMIETPIFSREYNPFATMKPAISTVTSALVSKQFQALLGRHDSQTGRVSSAIHLSGVVVGEISGVAL